MFTKTFPRILLVLFILSLISCTYKPVTSSTPPSLVLPPQTETRTPIPEPTATYTLTPESLFTPVAYALTDMDVPRFSIIQGFPGLSSNDINPPYPVIAAGPDRLILMHDNGAEIRTKHGEMIARSTLFRLFNNGFTDVRVVYDWYDNKFIISAWGWDYKPDCQPGECVADIYIAISKDSSPDLFSAEEWTSYKIDGTLQDNKPLAIWPDFISLGFNDKYIVLTGHRIKFASHEHVGDKIWVVEKDKLGSGGELSNWIEYANLIDPLSDSRVTDYQPALHLSNSDTFFLVSQAGNSCGVTVWGIDIEGLIRSESIKAPGICRNAPPAKQPGDFPPLSLSNGPKFHVQPIYNNGMLWATHTIQKRINNKLVSVVRWLEIDVSNWPNGISLVQEGYVEDEHNWVFYPAIMVNHNNDMALVYGKSGEDFYPSLMYTGRLNTDVNNTTLPESVIKLGYTSIDLPNEDNVVRYGSYFGISLDPVDDTIWVHGEYGGNKHQHTTWVSQINWTKMMPIFAEVGITESPAVSGFTNPSFNIEFDKVLSEDEASLFAPSDTITVKFLAVNLDVKKLSKEEIENICECGKFYSGLTNGGFENGYEIILIHFDKLKIGPNSITFVVENTRQTIIFPYFP